MCNSLKGTAAAPITRIKVDTGSGAQNTSFTTDPTVIDQQLLNIWGVDCAPTFGGEGAHPFQKSRDEGRQRTRS